MEKKYEKGRKRGYCWPMGCGDKAACRELYQQKRFMMIE
jgi:hypothetical protein